MTTITAANLETMRETVAAAAIDQAAELAPGCKTWPITYEGGQRGQMTVWPDTGRGAICQGGESAYGDWDEETRTLTLDAPDDDGDPIVYDETGSEC